MREVVERLGLDNVTPLNMRAEQMSGQFDYVVSRAVADVATLVGWTWRSIVREQAGTLPNGLLLLKGGDLSAELAAAGRDYTLYNIGDFFPDEEFFETKKVVFIPK